MTLGIRKLAMFASKNRQVVQIRIIVSHVEAVVYTGSLAVFMGYLCIDNSRNYKSAPLEYKS